jgi:hypothetical protein
MVACAVAVGMWLGDGSLGKSLALGLVCAGSYAALTYVGLYRKSRHHADTRPSEEPTPTD